jgi:hypothetical protein
LGGADAAQFSVNASTGVVSMVARNFESAADAGADNVYNYTLTATDADGNTDDQAVTVSVTDVNDNAPVFSSGATGSVVENAATSTVIYTAARSDADGTSANRAVVYSLKASTGDIALLDIDSSTGAVTLKASADFEAKPSYSFTVVATNAGTGATLSSEQAVTVNVNNLPEITTVGMSALNAQNNYLSATDTVVVTLTYDQAVTVNTSGGFPTVDIVVGGTTVQAVYTGGSGTAALTFSYVIQSAQSDSNGLSIIGNSLALNGGTLSATSTGLTAVNTFAGMADNANFLVDTTAPTTPATAPQSYLDNQGSIQNTTSTAATTDDDTPGVNIGSLPAGSTGANLYVDGVKVAATYDPATGALTPNTALATGQLYSLTYTLTDAAGNESGQSLPLSLTVNTSRPNPPVFDIVATDNIINAAEQSTTLTGTAQANSVVSLTLGNGNVRQVTANGSGVWSYTLLPADISAMGQGPETLSATATDAAGNTSLPGTRAISIDTEAPTLAINPLAGNEVVKKPDFQPTEVRPWDLSDFSPGISASSTKCAAFLALIGILDL